MVPIFLPDLRIDKVVRAMIGLTIFTSAYMAENVRGGLQGVGKGQYEAASALGMNGTLVMLLVVLPQALRAVIPSIVGQFISLFKDTSLVAIIGLLDLLGDRPERDRQSPVAGTAVGGVSLCRTDLLDLQLYPFAVEPPDRAGTRASPSAHDRNLPSRGGSRRRRS